MDYDHAFAKENLPALALGALGEEESARVREHLQHCPHCRAEYLSFENVAAALAYATPQVDPPPHLRHAIRAVAVPTSLGGARPFEQATSLSRAGRLVNASRFLLAALTLVTLGLLVWNVSLHQRMTVLAQESVDTREVGTLLLDYMEHPDAYVYFTMVGKVASHPPRAMVLVARTDNRLLFVAEGLPVEAGVMYTVWLLDRQGRRLYTRSVRCDEQGRAILLLHPPSPVTEIWRIRVTSANRDAFPLLEGVLPENQGQPLFMASTAL